MSEKNTHPTPFTQEVPASETPFLSFADERGIYITTTPENISLTLDQDVSYPSPRLDSELNRLLLFGMVGYSGERRLLLPENFVTLPQVLNDAIGDNKSDRSMEIARRTFAEIGSSLGRVARIDRQVPRDISYKNIILSREAPGVKLLPPIEFVTFNTRESDTAKNHTVAKFRESVLKGASNTTQQRNILEVLGGFIKAYDW